MTGGAPAGTIRRMGRRLTGLALIATAVCLADAAGASAAVGCIYHDEATPKYMAVTLTAPG